MSARAPSKKDMAPIVATATVVPVDTLTATAVKDLPTENQKPMTIQVRQSPSGASVNVPPGCKPGGVWGKVHYRGNKTGAATAVGCLLFFIPGLIILCFPLDKKYVYKVDGKYYNGEGKQKYNVRNFKSIPVRPW
jgi:hypothetical protein